MESVKTGYNLINPILVLYKGMVMVSPESRRPALVFDFGGVIFNWDPFPLFGSFFSHDRQTVETFMKEVDFRAWNHRLDMGEPFAAVVAEQCARFPQYADILQAYDQRWLETFAGAIEPTVELLAQLHSDGLPLYALSNWSEEKFRLIRPRYPFLGWFRQIVISGALGLAKPDPLIFKAFEEQTGLLAEDCLFIDDHLPNLEAAQARGWATIQFCGAAHLADELHQRGILN